MGVKSLIVEIIGDPSKLKKGLDESGADVGKFKNVLQKNFGDASGIIGQFAGAAGIGAAAVAVVGFAQKSIQSFDEAGAATLKFQQTAGGSAEAVSGLLAASNMLGVSSDDLTAATAKLTVAEGAHADTLKQMGVALVDSNGHARDQTSILHDTLVALGNETDVTKRNTEAKQLFGKAYTNILPLIAQSGKLTEAESQAKKNGLVLTQDQVDAAHENEIAMKRLQAALKGIEVEVGSLLVPQLTSAIDKITLLTQGANALSHVSFGAAGSLGNLVQHASLAGSGFGAAGMGLDLFNQATSIMDHYSKKAAVSVKDLADQTGQSEAQAKNWLATQKDAGTTYKSTADAAQAYMTAQSQATTTTDDAEQSQKKLDDELRTAQSELDKAKRAVEDYFKQWSSGSDLEANYQQAIDDLTEAVKNNGATLDLNTQKGRDNFRAVEAVRDAIIKKAQATYDETGSVEKAKQVADLYIVSLDNQFAALGYNKQQIDEFNQKLGLTPKAVDTAFTTSGLTEAQNNVANLTGQLDALNGRVINPSIIITFGNSQQDISVVQHGGGVQHRASGGPITAGMPYLVGENGPEMIVPGQSGRVIPNNALTGAGGNVYLTVHAGMGTDGVTVGKQIVDALAKWQQAGGRIPSSLVGA